MIRVIIHIDFIHVIQIFDILKVARKVVARTIKHSSKHILVIVLSRIY